MTKEQLEQFGELDRLAEIAGGYVADPESLEENPEGMRMFTAVRQYSLQHGILMSKLTEEDYRKIGVPFPPTLEDLKS